MYLKYYYNLDHYRQTDYVVGSRHLNGANYIADFERQTSYCSLDPVTLSFPSNTSLYDSILVPNKNNNNENVNNNKGLSSKDNSNLAIPHHVKLPLADHPKRKVKGRTSKHYVQ